MALSSRKNLPATRLAADEDVLRHREMGHQVEFLVIIADAP